jgi:hypothetical protein
VPEKPTTKSAEHTQHKRGPNGQGSIAVQIVYVTRKSDPVQIVFCLTDEAGRESIEVAVSPLDEVYAWLKAQANWESIELKARHCSHCGTLCNPFAPVCENCGAKVKKLRGRKRLLARDKMRFKVATEVENLIPAGSKHDRYSIVTARRNVARRMNLTTGTVAVYHREYRSLLAKRVLIGMPSTPYKN